MLPPKKIVLKERQINNENNIQFVQNFLTLKIAVMSSLLHYLIQNVHLQLINNSTLIVLPTICTNF